MSTKLSRKRGPGNAEGPEIRNLTRGLDREVQTVNDRESANHALVIVL